MDALNISSPFKYLFIILILVLLQILVCNNILIFGVAIPFIFIYILIGMPLNLNLNVFMGLSFLMGFLVDLFSDTLGLNCMACLMISVIRKPIFYAYMPKEDKYLNIVPSISSMGWMNYLKYTLTLSALFCILIFGIELFSYASIWRILLMASSSTVLTVLLLLAADSLVNKD